MTSSILRLSLLAAALGAALSADADYLYTFTQEIGSTPADYSARGFTLLVPSLVTSTATYTLGDGRLLSTYQSSLDYSGKKVTTSPTSLRLAPNANYIDGNVYDIVTLGATNAQVICMDKGAFSLAKSYNPGWNATLTVQAVPEPGAWAALGFGGLAVLRRRKRI